ncbi:toxin glutamine deamidase domain-containing protein [Streptomyces sp. NPDC002088]|uniref:toxin glutamine deamidase domain-containing protein n=1 Tax=Streptomyces sp. NPDC002088 TaxID=3154665 RepID=UPI003330756E
MLSAVAMMLPDELEWVLEMLGYHWPTANEDKLRDSAALWRKFGDDVTGLHTSANASARQVVAHNAGESIDAFTKTYAKFDGGGGDGYLANAAQAAYIIANVMEACAYLVEFAKWAVIAQLIALAIEIAAAQAAAPFTFGLSEVGALGATQVTRLIVRRLFDELKEALMEAIVEAMKEPAISMIEAIITDLIRQTVNVGFGAQEGYDLGTTVKAGTDSAWQAIKQTPQTLAEGVRDSLGAKAGQRAHHAVDSRIDGYNGGSGTSGSDGGDGDEGSNSSDGDGSSDSSDGDGSSDSSSDSSSRGSDSNGSDSNGSDSSTSTHSGSGTNIGGGISADTGGNGVGGSDVGSGPGSDSSGSHSGSDSGLDSGAPRPTLSHSGPTLSDFDDPSPSSTSHSGGDSVSTSDATSTSGPSHSGGSSVSGLSSPTAHSVPTSASSGGTSSSSGGHGSIGTSIDSLAASTPTHTNAAPAPTTSDSSPTAGTGGRADGGSGMPTSPMAPTTGGGGVAGGSQHGGSTPGSSASGTSPSSPTPNSGAARTSSVSTSGTSGTSSTTGSGPASTPSHTPNPTSRNAPDTTAGDRTTPRDTLRNTTPGDGTTPRNTPGTTPGDRSTPRNTTDPSGSTRTSTPGQNSTTSTPNQNASQSTPSRTTSSSTGNSTTSASTSIGTGSDRTSTSSSGTSNSSAPSGRTTNSSNQPGTTNSPTTQGPSGTPGTQNQPGTGSAPNRPPQQPAGSTPSSPQQPAGQSSTPAQNTPPNNNSQQQQQHSQVTPVPVHTPIRTPGASASPSHANPAAPQQPGSPQATPGDPSQQQHPHQDSLEDIRADLDHYPGGLTDPDPADQQALVDAVPHNEDGTPQRFPDPFGSWSQLQNDGGNTVPGRSNNCADCSRSFLETWYGNPQVSAPRTLDTDANGNPDPWSPEHNANDNQIRWTGAAHTYAGPGNNPDTADNIASTLQQAGHGSAAIVQVDWPGGGGHAFNAVNHHGNIIWIDTQSGQVSNTPLHIDNAAHVWHIPLDANQNPIDTSQPHTQGSENSEQGTDTSHEGSEASQEGADTSQGGTDDTSQQGTDDSAEEQQGQQTTQSHPSAPTPDPTSGEDSDHQSSHAPTELGSTDADRSAPDRHPSSDSAPSRESGDASADPAGTDRRAPEAPAGSHPEDSSIDPLSEGGDNTDDGAPPESSSSYEERQSSEHQHYGVLGDEAQRDLRERNVHQIDQERVYNYLENLANNDNQHLRQLLAGSENGTTWRRDDLMKLPGFSELSRGQQLATVAALARLSIDFHTNQGVGTSPHTREGENSAYKWREDAEREPLRQRDVLRQKNYDGVDNHESSRAAGVRAKSDFSNVDGSDNKSSSPAQRTRHHLDETYGESVADQIVAATEGMKPDFSGRNFAVIEVFDPHSQQTHYVADSSFSHAGPRPAHSEPHIGGWIERLNEDRAAEGKQPFDVVHMYTEREPCGHPSESPGHADCSGYILKYLPEHMPVSYGTGYRKGEQAVPFSDPKGREGVNTARQAMEADFQHHLNRISDILAAYALPTPTSDS